MALGLGRVARGLGRVALGLGPAPGGWAGWRLDRPARLRRAAACAEAALAC